MFKCPQCSSSRESAEEPCAQCGWAPKAGAFTRPGDPTRAALLKREPQRGKLVAIVIAAGVVLLLSAGWLSSEPLGGACFENNDCRSHSCLINSGIEGFCTQSCGDTECPEGWTCQEVSMRTSSSKLPGQVRESSPLFCVPP